MVISGINYKISNNSLNFGAQTRSEREANKEKAYTRMTTIVLPEEDLEILETAKRNAERKRKEQEEKFNETAQTRKAEKQYKKDVRELRETRSMINDITQNHDFTGGTLQKVGKAADILITATLSGMALHWSTGKAFMMIRGVCKKPKVAKTLKNIKRPFEIVGSALADGAKSAWKTLSTKVKATESGKKFVNSKPIKAINKSLNEVSTSYKNFKKDAKDLTAEDIKSGISTIFGVSGFAAGVVEKLDKSPSNGNRG